MEALDGIVVSVLISQDGALYCSRDQTADKRLNSGYKKVSSELLLSVSISYDGRKKYDKVLTCGIPTTDFAQHKMFVLKLNIEDECPHDPCQLSFVDLCLLAREYMLSQGVELTPATCDAFLVTAHQKDISKPNEADPKYRAVLNVVKSEKLYVPGCHKLLPCHYEWQFYGTENFHQGQVLRSSRKKMEKRKTGFRNRYERYE